MLEQPELTRFDMVRRVLTHRGLRADAAGTSCVSGSPFVEVRSEGESAAFVQQHATGERRGRRRQQEDGQ
jgi:hypothetical protein